MRTRGRIAEIRLMDKVMQNPEYAKKVGISIDIKLLSNKNCKRREEYDVGKKNEE